MAGDKDPSSEHEGAGKAASAAAAAGPAGAVPGASKQQHTASATTMVLHMDDFANFEQIGKGKDCVVYAATCAKLGGGTVVLKVYEKARLSAVKNRSVRREAKIMRFITENRLPHCCRYIGAFQDARQIFIVMEHCGGGDLLELLLKEGRAMTEKRVVREVVVPVLTALAHLHAAGIIHRDIKLENLFVSQARGIMLGDYGLALCVHEEKPISPVGTLEYMAPEILRLPTTDLILNGTVKAEDVPPVDEKVDQWSFGVTVYELVTGRSPFEGSAKEEVRSNILRNNMRPLPGFLTPECAEWIRASLAVDPAARPGALQLLKHKWVLKNLRPDESERIMQLKVRTPQMLPAPAPAATAVTAAPAAAGPPSPAAVGLPTPAEGDSGAKQAAAAAAVATLVEKVEDKQDPSRNSEAGGKIPAYVPDSHQRPGAGASSGDRSSCSSGSQPRPPVVAGAVGAGNSASTGSSASVPASLTGSVATVASAPASPGRGGGPDGRPAVSTIGEASEASGTLAAPERWEAEQRLVQTPRQEQQAPTPEMLQEHSMQRSPTGQQQQQLQQLRQLQQSPFQQLAQQQTQGEQQVQQSQQREAAENGKNGKKGILKWMCMSSMASSQSL